MPLGKDTLLNAVKDGIDATGVIENPFSTANGQLVNSVSESFWARKLREAVIKNGIAEEVNTTISGGYNWGSGTTASAGKLLYPVHGMVTCDQDAILYVKVDTKITDAPMVYYGGFFKAGSPLIVEFTGELYCLPTGSIQFGCKPKIDNAKKTCSFLCLEVTQNV
ncbi:MAG: hypothetical protein ACD_20C00169G0002 [uncultured bacterium]|nr:MAG: hypothetical protein ACD_20C00169G0002 [uncultured bacterium]